MCASLRKRHATPSDVCSEPLFWARHTKAAHMISYPWARCVECFPLFWGHSLPQKAAQCICSDGVGLCLGFNIRAFASCNERRAE